MKKIITLFFLSLLILSCNQQAEVDQPSQPITNPEFTVDQSKNPELQYEDFRLFPIVGSQEFINDNAEASNLINLEEAIHQPKFRITEKKPYGRANDRSAVNNLTIQNKTQDTIFLMTGDVVQGGKQDRVIAQDMAIPPRTLTDIAVFCVEKGRWDYSDEETTSEADKKTYAFRGYYKVASNDLRKTVKLTNNQEEVWKKVGEITSIHNASNSTDAYTGLENSKEFTNKRSRCLKFFEDKFDGNDQVIGIIAVNGNKVLGADIFGHPSLFNKQYNALLHSYITEYLSNKQEKAPNKESFDHYLGQIQEKFHKSSDAKYEFNGLMVHFTDF